MSASSLASILAEIKQQGVPDLHGRNHVRQARNAKLESHSAYGPMLKEIQLVAKDGSKQPCIMVNFLTMMQALFELGGGYHDLLKATFNAKPCSRDMPYNLIFYSDEVVCGNPLSADTSRKVQVVYLSLKEYGAIHLSKEQAWICVLAMRSNKVQELEAGMTQVAAAILKECLYSPAANTKEVGVMLKDTHGFSSRLFLKIGMFLQDGLAHQTLFSLKGHTGHKFCHLRLNLYAKKAKFQDEDGCQLLTASTFDKKSIIKATDQDVLGTCHRLKQAYHRMSKRDFAIKETSVGFVFNSHALLFDQSLGHDMLPVQQIVHDWMHTYLVKGCFQTITYHLIDILQDEFKLDMYALLLTFVQNWNVPKKEKLASLFNQKRKQANAKATTFKCTASEGLALYPILAYWAHTMILPQQLCKQQCHAFLALADLLDLIVDVPLGLVSSNHMEAAQDRFIQACLVADWASIMTTKFHWCTHMAAHLFVHNMLPSCFVQERKHKIVKRYGQTISNTVKFEQSTMSEIICHDLFALSAPDTFSTSARLLSNCKPTKAHQDHATVSTAPL